MLNLVTYFELKKLFKKIIGTENHNIRIIGNDYDRPTLISIKKKNEKGVWCDLYTISDLSQNVYINSTPLWNTEYNYIASQASISYDSSMMILTAYKIITVQSKSKNRARRKKVFQTYLIDLVTDNHIEIFKGTHSNKLVYFLSSSHKNQNNKTKQQETKFYLIIFPRRQIFLHSLSIPSSFLFKSKNWKVNNKKHQKLTDQHIWSQFDQANQYLWILTTRDYENGFELQLFIFTAKNKFKKFKTYNLNIMKEKDKLCNHQPKTKTEKEQEKEKEKKQEKEREIEIEIEKENEKEQFQEIEIEIEEQEKDKKMEENKKKGEKENELKIAKKTNKKKEQENKIEIEIEIEKVDGNENQKKEEKGVGTISEGDEVIGTINEDYEIIDINEFKNINKTSNKGQQESAKKKKNNNPNNLNKFKSLSLHQLINKKNKKNDLVKSKQQFDKQGKNNNNNKSKGFLDFQPQHYSKSRLNSFDYHYEMNNSKRLANLKGITIKGDFKVVTLSNEVHCLCKQEVRNVDKNIISFIATIFILEKFEKLVFNIPTEGLSRESILKTKIFFGSIRRDLLLIWIPNHYFHLIDCELDHSTCTSFLFESDSPFLTDIQLINNNLSTYTSKNVTKETNTSTNTSTKKKKKTKTSTNTSTSTSTNTNINTNANTNTNSEENTNLNIESKKIQNQKILPPHLISLSYDKKKIIYDLRTGCAYRYKIDFQNIIYLIASKRGKQYSDLIIHFCLSHFKNPNEEKEELEHSIQMITKFIIYYGKHNLNKRFFKEYIINSTYNQFKKIFPEYNLSFHLILPITTIPKFQSIERKINNKTHFESMHLKNKKKIRKAKKNLNKNVNNAKVHKFQKYLCKFQKKNNKLRFKKIKPLDFDHVWDLWMKSKKIQFTYEKYVMSNHKIPNKIKQKNRKELVIKQEKKTQGGWGESGQVQLSEKGGELEQELVEELPNGNESQIGMLNNKQRIIQSVLDKKFIGINIGKKIQDSRKLSLGYITTQNNQLKKIWEMIKSKVIDDNVLNSKKSSKLWFKIFENMYTIIQELFLLPPKNFHKLFVKLAYASLPAKIFYSYLEHNIFKIDIDFVVDFIKSNEDFTLIYKLITHLNNREDSQQLLLKHSPEKKYLIQYFLSKVHHYFENVPSTRFYSVKKFAAFEIPLKILSEKESNIKLNDINQYLFSNVHLYFPTEFLNENNR
ncbi:gamma-secretase-activating protein [Anaeramoeba flamelloides]|uniref:Gamma-secretase-activating protein n=1 Tax=Anaeramoeba flamelloides TaxID=1746091 RepID=A0AAV8A665_9EUKA|nr:gamma-secretase-activating protein [Anaeramoeba flamelloides]